MLKSKPRSKVKDLTLRQIISLHLSLHKKQNDRLNFKTNNKFTFRPYLVKTFGETQ